MFSIVYLFADSDLSGARKCGLGGDYLDTELLLGEADGADKLAHDLGLPCLHGLPVEADIVGRDSELRAFAGVDIELGGVEEGLRGDAACVEAGASQAGFLGQEDLPPAPGEAFGREIAARSAA